MKPFLDRFCAAFPGSKWFQVGAGCESEELELTIWNNLAGSSFLPGQSERFKHLPRRTVPIVAIDHLIQRDDIPVPDLVKVDVQGFELEVLKGGTTCFGHTEVFIIEVSFFRFLPNQPLFHEVVSFMYNNGYVVYGLPHLLPRPLDGALGQADVYFAKQDGLLRANRGWAA